MPVPNSGFTQGVVGGEPYNLNTSTALKTSDSYLIGVWCSTAGTVGVYNGTNTNGVVISRPFAMTAGFWYPMPFHCVNGVYIFVSGGTPDITVSMF